MENFDIFNLSLDNFKIEEKPKTGSDLYKTDPKLAKDSVFRSIVRFIPNLSNPKQSMIRKFSYWLEDADGNGFYADCPSSINEKSIIQDTFWKLYKSESAFDKKQAERIKRKEYYYSYILVVKDPQSPEKEGTIQILRYPKAVKKLIDAQISPDASDIELGVEPTNVFDFFEGKDFSLKVTLKGGYWNYDECKFAEKKSAIQIQGAKMKNDKESKDLILSLYKDLPLLEVNAFRPWTEEEKEKVFKYISDVTGNPGKSYSAATSYGPPKSNMSGTTKPPEQLENINEDLTSISSQATSSDGDIEDWLKEFENK